MGTFMDGVSSCGKNTASGTPGHRTPQDKDQVGSRSKISSLSWATDKNNQIASMEQSFLEDDLAKTLWLSNPASGTRFSTVTSAQRATAVNTGMLVTGSLVIQMKTRKHRSQGVGENPAADRRRVLWQHALGGGPPGPSVNTSFYCCVWYPLWPKPGSSCVTAHSLRRLTVSRVWSKLSVPQDPHQSPGCFRLRNNSCGWRNVHNGAFVFN